MQKKYYCFIYSTFNTDNIGKIIYVTILIIMYDKYMQKQNGVIELSYVKRKKKNQKTKVDIKKVLFKHNITPFSYNFLLFYYC